MNARHFFAVKIGNYNFRASILLLHYLYIGFEIAQPVQLRAMGWTAGFNSRQEQDFSLLRRVQTDAEALPASYPMGTGGSFYMDKAAGA
jgi:hypothetical protein